MQPVYIFYSMKYYSTNRNVPSVSFREAVFKGLPDDNGLYMPEEIPSVFSDFLKDPKKFTFQDIAFLTAKPYLKGEISDEELKNIIEDAFNFPVPVKQVHDNIHVLELFHGPTLAFKDFGARFMSRVMGHFLKSENKEINILVATSGDTGSAVAQGFLGVEGIKVTLLFPKGKVSFIQEQQLTTIGHNVTALEVDGTFDDCQKMVKTAFLDEGLSKKLQLSSANSINIARLLPQSFYYTYAFSQVWESGTDLYFCVPSGNFGNLCGGLLAMKMGLPVKQFIAATNINDIVPYYLASGIFNPRSSKMTISNAMDVGNPSNFARLIELYENNFESVAKDIRGISFNDEETKEIIKEVFEKYQYLMCPHTAIGYGGLRSLMPAGKKSKGIFLSTAHPAKFKDIVESLISKEIELPERLRKIVEKKKNAVSISNDYEDLKSFLLK